jgi:hypothetical protein
VIHTTYEHVFATAPHTLTGTLLDALAPKLITLLGPDVGNPATPCLLLPLLLLLLLLPCLDPLLLLGCRTRLYVPRILFIAARAASSAATLPRSGPLCACTTVSKRGWLLLLLLLLQVLIRC